MGITNIITLIGGLALFLFGMNVMSGSLEKLAGGNLERWLEKLTKKPIMGVLLGLGVTAIIQSSSATTVMLVSFVNSGIMKLSQAIGVIMGANIGTTATSWLLSLSTIEGAGIFNVFKPENFSPILALIGIILTMFCKSDKKHSVGTILLGFATLMFGMESMSAAVEPLKDIPEFGEIMTMFSNPILGVLAGAILTAIIQSSSASVGILQAVSNSTGGISYATALPIILGQNIGTCVTALIASIGANKSAKRVAIVHLYFNCIGTILFLCLFYILNSFIDFAFMESAIDASGIAVIHSVFNITATAVFLPFTKQFEKLACITIRDKKGDEENKQSMLDERMLKTPSVAIEHCRNVCHRMAQLTCETLKMSLETVLQFDREKCAKVIENENVIDHYEDKIGSYILKISSKDLSVNDSKAISGMLHTIGDLERISDHAVNIVEAAEEMHDKKIHFSDEAVRELTIMINAVTEIIGMSIKAFEEQDISLAKRVEPLEDVIDILRTELKSRHIARLRSGKCTIELGFVLQDLLTNFERVSDHCSNIAVYLIQINDNNNMDTHKYLNELKKPEGSEFMEEFNDYQKKYLLPEPN